MIRNFFKDVNKKEAISWAFFDFANSAYTLLIVSFVFPIYFRDVIAGSINGDFWWGLAVSVSTLIGGIITPVIGAIADYDSRRKSKFILFSMLTIIGTAALYFTGPGLLVSGLLLFIFMNLCFEIAQTLYDSFLIHVSTEETVGRISGLGWGIGYLGGVIAMLLLRPLYVGGYAGELETMYKLTFPLTALFFFIFALPSFVFIKEHSIIKKKESLINIIKIGFQNTFKTIKEVKKHKKIAWFLVAFYILSDALVTIFAFVPIYAKVTLGFSLSEIAILLLIVQLIGFPAAIFFGWLSDKKGSKKILLFTIFIWIIIVLAASVAYSKTFFYILSILTGVVIGASQAIARSWFSRIIPKEKRCEFFGFNGFASKVAATTGPLIFGIISSLTGNQRIAIAAMAPYFIISFIIFYKIEDTPVLYGKNE